MSMIDKHINSLIIDIISEIEAKNIDFVELSDNLSLDPDDFLKILGHPIRNISLYLDILEEVRNERN